MALRTGLAVEQPDAAVEAQLEWSLAADPGVRLTRGEEGKRCVGLDKPWRGVPQGIACRGGQRRGHAV
jgi:hypothetical protein